MTSRQTEAPCPSIHGFNPISHHYVKKTGAVWLRLVMAGMAEDPELMQKIKEKALTRKKAAASEDKKPPAANRPLRPKPDSKAKAERAARKLVGCKRSELDDLESDAVVEQICKLLLKRATLAAAEDELSNFESSSDDESEPVSRKPRRLSAQLGPLPDRIHLKTQPIPIPDRRAALRQSRAQPLDSEEDD